MLQYKLIEVLDKDTLNELNIIFGSENIIELTDKIIGIRYNLDSSTYIDILKKIVGLNVRQWILTSSRFINIIKYSIDNNLLLDSIDFLECIDKVHSDNVNSSITKVKMAKDSNEKIKLRQLLIEDLNWIMLDQCIDIKSVLLSYQVKFPPFLIEVRFFNNGVLYIDDKNIVACLKQLFEDCFGRR